MRERIERRWLDSAESAESPAPAARPAARDRAAEQARVDPEARAALRARRARAGSPVRAARAGPPERAPALVDQADRKFVSGSTWTMVGTPPAANSGGGSENGPVVRVSTAGDLFVASMMRVGTAYQMSAARYDGSVWQLLGTQVSSTGAPRDYDMAIDASGAPIVADAEGVAADSGDRMFTYRWNGTGWPAFAPAETATPPPQVIVAEVQIAIDSKNGLVAAWRHGTTGVSAIAVARYQP
jgi:hypothetical protein